MKLIILAAVVAAAAAAKLDNTYLPPVSASTAGGSAFLNAPRPSAFNAGIRGSVQASAAPAGSYSGAATRQIAILKLNSDNPGDGSYRYEYETENKISAQEAGQVRNAGSEEINQVQGQFAYVGDDGATYSITYTADENGFNPQGAHLPVAPAIPEEILESLRKNAADEAAGIVDDGSYRAEHQGEGVISGNRFASVSNQYIAPKQPSFNNNQGGYKY